MSLKLKAVILLPLSVLLANCGAGTKRNSVAEESSRNHGSSAEHSPAYLNQFCRPELRQRCQDLSSKVDDLRQQRERAREGEDQGQLAQLNMDIGFNQELLQIYRQGADENHPDIQKLHKDYDAIYEVVSVHNLPPYSPNERAAVKRVFDDHGPLYIKASRMLADGKPDASVAKVENLPWSSYWYPKRDRSIFEGDAAPLVKFDQVLTKLGRKPEAASYEANQFSPFFAEWEGLCDAWAVAAISTKEPKQGIDFNGVHFSVSDLKALAIKMYEGGDPKIYGNRYFGDYRTDGEIQDIRPEAFHRLVMSYLGEKGTLVAIDDDPGPEVWVKPLFHVRWVITADANRPNVYNVKAWPRMMDNRNHISDDLTSMRDIKAPVYTYRLYTDPTQVNAAGEQKVIYGEWVDKSLIAHPDMVILPGEKLSPVNKGLAANLDVLRELLKAAQVL